MTELTQDRLKELFNYDPETGDFTRLVNRRNSKAGSIAGTISNGYIVVKINNKIYKAHRLAFLYMNGKFPEKGLQVDHINHKRDDNQWVNLRIVTPQGNQKNRTLHKNNSSGCVGVSRVESRDKWRADIKDNGEIVFLGHFDNLDDAIAARKAAEIKYNYHENHGTIT